MLATLGKHLHPKEAEFLQRLLTIFQTELRPEIAAKEERKNGLWHGIEPSTITLNHADGDTKTYAGGYFPARYGQDVAIGEIAEKQEHDQIKSFYERGYERPATAKSHTKPRAAGYTNTLNLDWSVIPSHIAQVVHDIAFDEYVRDTARVLIHPEVKNAIFQHFGEGRKNAPVGWLT